MVKWVRILEAGDEGSVVAVVCSVAGAVGCTGVCEGEACGGGACGGASG